MSPIRTLAWYWQLTRQRAREGHLSAARQLWEMAVLACTTVNGPGFYHMAGFWRRSIPWSDKKEHLSARAYRRRLEQLNPWEYRKLTQNKLPEKALLSLLGFRTPAFVGFLHPVSGRTADGRPLRDAIDFERVLQAAPDAMLCVKPTEGWGGKGVEMLEVCGRSPLCLRQVRTGAQIDVESFVQSLLKRYATQGLMVERFLEQHHEMARFNPTSVNTCRIWTARADGGQARVLLAYLRIGRAGSLVDNQSSGGIVAPIDMTTGTVGAAIDGLPSRCEYAQHPDHGAAIAGCVIPEWDRVRAFAEEVLGAIPHLRFAGLDIALGCDGPVVLELNASPDREGAAFAGIPSGRVLATL